MEKKAENRLTQTHKHIFAHTCIINVPSWAHFPNTGHVLVKVKPIPSEELLNIYWFWLSLTSLTDLNIFMGAQCRVQTGHRKLSLFVFFFLFLYSFFNSGCQKLYIWITVFNFIFFFHSFFLEGNNLVTKDLTHFILSPRQNASQTGTRSQAKVFPLVRENFPPARTQDTLGVFDIQESFSSFPIVIPSSCATFHLEEKMQRESYTLRAFPNNNVTGISSDSAPILVRLSASSNPSDIVPRSVPDTMVPFQSSSSCSRMVILDSRH